MTAEARPLKVAVAGFGTVGRSVAKILCEGHHRALRLVAVCTRRPAEGRRGAPWVPPDVLWTGDIHDVLASPADVIVELIGGVEPARAWISAALQSGRAVATANKQVLAEHGPGLISLARSTGSALRFEAAVAGGVPVILGLQDGLAGDRVTRIAGVVNGTCNFIVLGRMTDAGVSLDEAVREAQARGFAETDPGRRPRRRRCKGQALHPRGDRTRRPPAAGRHSGLDNPRHRRGRHRRSRIGRARHQAGDSE